MLLCRQGGQLKVDTQSMKNFMKQQHTSVHASWLFKTNVIITYIRYLCVALQNCHTDYVQLMFIENVEGDGVLHVWHSMRKFHTGTESDDPQPYLRS